MTTRKRALARLDLEIKQHIEEATRDHLARGLSPEEARQAALREFGNITRAKEDTRAVWIPLWLDQMLQDVHYGLRLLRRYPGFTTVTILTLALAIGASTAIFTVVNQILLNPPGISHPERLVAIRVNSKNYKDVNVSAPVFADIRDSRLIFEHAAAEDFVSLNYSEGPDPLKLTAAAVTREWFDVFGAKPIAGRVFAAEEDQPGVARVAVLAHATWVQLFGADPTVIGRTVEFSQQFYKIIGIMDASFEWPRQTALWIPLALPPEAFAPQQREGGTLNVIARMQPKARFQQAASWVGVLTERAKNQGTPDSLLLKNLGWAMVAKQFVEESSGGTQKALLVLLASVGLVLLIACLNIAGLLLARSSSRAHELAMRAALGAGRLRIIRQLLSESLLLAAAGALLGLFLAQGLTRLLLTLAPEELSIGVHASPDVHVLVFTFLVALLSGLVFGILPAVQMSKPESAKAGGTRAGTLGPSGQRQRSALVILETALSVVLLVGAGLLLRTLNALEKVNPGFDSHGVLTAMFSLPTARYPDGVKQAEFYRTVLDRLTHSAGVASAGIGVGIPFNNWIWGLGFAVEGEQRTPGEPLHEGIRQWVTPSFFDTLKIPLQWGRYLSDDDRMGGPPAAVIDETLAHQFWSAENPPRSRISLADGRDLIPVVGVVPHVHTIDLTGDKALGGLGTVYFSLFQHKQQFPFPPVGWIVARTEGDPYTLTATIRDAVRQADKDLPVADIKSLDDLIAYTLTPRRFVMRMLESFAITAIFMAALGLYGVISFSVTRRTREIGIRIALGASPNRVRRTVILEGMSLSFAGTVVGLMVAYGLAGQLASLLYGTSLHDPITFITVPIFSLILTFVACFIPAQRASRTRPADALRWE